MQSKAIPVVWNRIFNNKILFFSCSVFVIIFTVCSIFLYLQNIHTQELLKTVINAQNQVNSINKNLIVLLTKNGEKLELEELIHISVSLSQQGIYLAIKTVLSLMFSLRAFCIAMEVFCYLVDNTDIFDKDKLGGDDYSTDVLADDNDTLSSEDSDYYSYDSWFDERSI
jgi:hypothetical protein